MTLAFHGLIALGSLVDSEPQQAALLEKICKGKVVPTEDMQSAGEFELPVVSQRKRNTDTTPDLFESSQP